jgi:ABC-type proline/glycine betaine transport system permease subunit
LLYQIKCNIINSMETIVVGILAVVIIALIIAQVVDWVRRDVFEK